MAAWWKNPEEDYEAPLSDVSPSRIKVDKAVSKGQVAFTSQDDLTLAARFRKNQSPVRPTGTTPYRPIVSRRQIS
jgi:hypothetical protein